MKRIVLILALLLPAAGQGQLNFQAKVTTHKKPDMTVRRYMYGPVEADTSYIGESGYLLPRYEQPAHSADSKVYWAEKLLYLLNSGDTLQYSNRDDSLSAVVFPGTAGENIATAGSLADSLKYDPHSIVLDNGGNAVYQLPEAGQ